jgi:hypothetical protein
VRYLLDAVRYLLDTVRVLWDAVRDTLKKYYVPNVCHAVTYLLYGKSKHTRRLPTKRVNVCHAVTYLFATVSYLQKVQVPNVCRAVTHLLYGESVSPAVYQPNE